jgi:hypothetical protein
MKKEIFIALLIISLISSCSPTKDKRQALNDYLHTVILDTSSKEIIIIKDKINSNLTIEIFNVNDIIAIDSKWKGKADTIIYNERDWKKMEKRYAVDYQAGKNPWFINEFWTKEDFDHKKIIFEDSYVGKTDAFLKKYDYKPSIDIYSFSDPIYYKNKSVVVFTVHKTATPIGFGQTYIIIMNKKRGKWIVTHKGLPDWHS